MTPQNNTMKILMAALEADTPVLLWGDSGTGKTAAIEALAKQKNAAMVTLIGSQTDPVDVGGYMVPNQQGVVVSSPPPWAVRLRAALDAGRPAWLFLDEISCAPPAVQAAFLRVVNEREVGGLRIDGCRIVGAANPEEVAADNGYLSPAMALRWLHLDYKPDYQEWAQGELQGWGKERTAAHINTSALLCSYIRKTPKALMPADAGGKEWKGRGAPRPRTWSMAAKALSRLGGSSARDTILSAAGLMLLSGLVGEASANELISYVSALDLADPDDYLLKGKKLPVRGDLHSAAMDSVVAAVISNSSGDRVERAWKVIGSGRPDSAIVPAKALLASFPEHQIPQEAIELGNKLLGITV